MNKLLNFLNKASGIDVQALETEKQKLEQLVVSLKQKYSECNSRLALTQSELEQKNKEAEQLQILLQNNESEINRLQTVISEVESQLQNLQVRSEEQQQSIVSTQGQYEQLLSEKNELALEYAELQRVLQGKDEELKHIREQVEKLTSGQADLEQKSQKLEEQIQILEGQKKDLEDQLTGFEVQNKELETRTADLVEKLEQETVLLEKEQAVSAGMQEQAEQKNQEIEKLKQELLLRNQDNVVLTESKKALEEQVSAIREELKTVEDEKGQTIASLEQLQLENNVLRQKVTDLQQKVETGDEANSQMKHVLDVQANEYADLQSSYQNQMQDYAQLKAELDTLNKINQDLGQQKSELEKSVADQGNQTQKLADLENQLASLHSENVAFRDKFAAMETERTNLMKRLEQLQQYCTELEKQATKPNFQYRDGLYLMPYGHEIKADTSGVFSYGSYISNTDKQEVFPLTLVPVKGTQVVVPAEHSDASPTFWGKALSDALSPVLQIERDIRLSVQSSLAVPNRNYGIHPDVLVSWPSKNIRIAVHVDELYEFSTKKPLHYKDSVDNIIDRLYVDCGWIVMRFSEDQVLGGMKQVVSYICNQLFELTGDGRFLIKVSDHLKTAKWTREDALHAANRRCRENLMERRVYLALCEYNKVFTAYNGELPDVDVLPSLKVVLETLSKRPMAGAQTLRLTVLPYYSQQLLALDQFQFDGVYLSGYDLITEKQCKVSILQVDKLEYVDELFKSKVYQFDPRSSQDLDALQSLLAEAICNYNPVQIQYVNGQGVHKTNLYWTAFKPQTGTQVSLPYAHLFQSLLDDVVEPELLVTMSTQHNRAIQFDIRQICQLQVFDAFVTSGDGIDSLMTGVYLAELKAQLELADLLYQNIPGNFKKLPFVQANYAHLCVMKGDIKKAADIYLSIPEDEEIGEGKTWQELNKADFQDLIRHDADPKNFIKVAEILAGHNWTF